MGNLNQMGGIRLVDKRFMEDRAKKLDILETLKQSKSLIVRRQLSNRFFVMLAASAVGILIGNVFF